MQSEHSVLSYGPRFLRGRIVIKGVWSKEYSVKISWVGLHIQCHASGMWQHQEWPSVKKNIRMQISACMEAQPTEMMQQKHGIPWYVCGILPYAVLNSGFLFHTTPYIFLKDLVRSCAIDCALVQLLTVAPHQPAPPDNLVWISLSQWHEWLSKGPGWMPTTNGKMKEDMMGHSSSISD